MGWRLGLGHGTYALAAASPGLGLLAVLLVMQDATAGALLGRLSLRTSSLSIAATTLPAVSRGLQPFWEPSGPKEASLTSTCDTGAQLLVSQRWRCLSYRG